MADSGRAELEHYWLVPNCLGGGAWPAAHLDWLARAGVSVLINLTDYGYEDARFRIHGIPVPDGAAPAEAQILGFCRLVDSELDRQRTIYVHCVAGCGRTGTMMACYLVYRDRMDPTTAIERVRAMRSCSIETAAQAEAVTKWAALMQANEYRLVAR